MSRLKDMIEDGFALTKAAKKLDISISDAKKEVAQNAYKLKLEKFSDSEIPRILELYESGVSAKVLGQKYGIGKRRVLNWAKEKGIDRTISESIRATYFNESIFDVVDTKEKAYWLGFFYADAYNSDKTNTLVITLQGGDYEHLLKCARFFDWPEKYVDKKITKDGHFVSTLKIYSKHICGRLTELGCPRAKSLIIKYPEWLNKSLHSHFIRGIFDGDGSLCVRGKEWKFSIVSTKECAKSISNIIEENTGEGLGCSYISKTGNNTCELETNGNEKIQKIMKFLYANSDTNSRLDRKYDKYLELIKQQSSRTFNRDNYKVSEDVKNKIKLSNLPDHKLAKQFNIHRRTVAKIKKGNQFSDIVVIDNQPLTAKYIKTLSKEEREKYVQPLFEHFRKQGWMYPKKQDFELRKEYNKLFNLEMDLTKTSIFNNSSVGTSICKHFCESFYDTTERGRPTMKEVWEDDDKLLKLVKNRLVINWNSSVNETFNISTRMMIQGMRSMRAVPAISIFKPEIAKFICMKYSEPGDVVGDFSAGFGGRLLGAMSSNRKYIGTDPLTAPELQKMIDFFGFYNAEVIHLGSENYLGDENSVDLYWSSPPYFDQEVYSHDKTQAYNNGEEYFYNVYWLKTLENVKHMLKPGKWFGLNVKNYPKMLCMAEDIFGPVVEKIALTTIRSHLTKVAGTSKEEYVYMFKNNK